VEFEAGGARDDGVAPRKTGFEGVLVGLEIVRLVGTSATPGGKGEAGLQTRKTRKKRKTRKGRKRRLWDIPALENKAKQRSE
jgi:hypothetical protein